MATRTKAAMPKPTAVHDKLLEPAQFQLTNPKWDEFVASIVDDVKEALGLSGHKLAAHLYKLLVYEEGSFFLPHGDGEKLDRSSPCGGVSVQGDADRWNRAARQVARQIRQETRLEAAREIAGDCDRRFHGSDRRP